MVRAVQWQDGDQPGIRLIDQTRLPAQEHYLHVRTVDDLVAAIQSLAVRGAPALGAVGALGVAMAMRQGEREGWSASRVATEIDRIRDARPTAVNLAWGVDRVRPLVAEGQPAVLDAARAVLAEDEAANRALSRHGADWLLRVTGRDRLRIITHCNTGALATSAWGTAYGIIHELHDRGALDLVYADETRPLLQGSRLTSWELTQDGIPHVIQADGAAASTILRGLVDVAIIGADRITANGDTANKVGSVALALACQRGRHRHRGAGPGRGAGVRGRPRGPRRGARREPRLRRHSARPDQRGRHRARGGRAGRRPLAAHHGNHRLSAVRPGPRGGEPELGSLGVAGRGVAGEQCTGE
jgi:methylthioribose-1-phosphate isomerase